MCETIAHSYFNDWRKLYLFQRAMLLKLVNNPISVRYKHFRHFTYRLFWVWVRPTTRLQRSGLPTLVFWPLYTHPSLSNDKNIYLSLSHRPRHIAWHLTLHVTVVAFPFRRSSSRVSPFHFNRLWHIGSLMTRTSAVALYSFNTSFLHIYRFLSHMSRPLQLATWID